MLKRYFLSNLIVMVLLNLLVKPIWIFLIDRNVQLTVGHQSYGMYSALLSISIIFSIVLDFGITNFNNRSIANDSESMHLALPNMMAAKVVFSIFYFILILISGFIFQYNGKALYILFLLGGVQFLNSFLQFLRSNVSANHDFKIDGVLSVLDKLIMIIVCGFLLLWPTTRSLFRIEWYLYAQLSAYAISIAIAFLVIIKRYAQIKFRHVTWLEMRRLCVKSLPYALLILLMGIYMRSDALLLERIKGPQITSIYAEAYRILDALNMIGFLFAGILLPMFTRLIARNNNVHEIVKTSANIIVSMSLAIVAHSVLYKTEIMHLLDKNAATDLPMIYLLIVSSFPAYCVMYIYSTLLTANGNIYLLIKMALLGTLLSIGLNLLLIPSLDAIGAGITALIVQSSVATVSIYFCMKKFQLPFDWQWIGKFVLLFIVFCLLNLMCKVIGISLLISIPINMIVFVSLVYLIKLWDKETILQYVKQSKV